VRAAAAQLVGFRDECVLLFGRPRALAHAFDFGNGLIDWPRAQEP